jgi:exodeoxyribonuclease-5
MSDIILSEAQKSAVQKIVKWFNDENSPQVFRLFGFAGTGKSTLVKYFIEDLGLHIGSSVLAATYTGKAALVLTRHGMPCSTIHSLIYRVREITEAEVDVQRAVVHKLQKGLEFAMPPDEREAATKKLAIEERKLRNMFDPDFSLSEESALCDAKLLILDEVSMVDQDMAADLVSFEKKILVLGDPGQLPPIKGEGAFTQQEPDVMLTEIHRQALDNPIIRLSMLAREGKPIPHGRFSDEVMKVHRFDIPESQLVHADQVICGRNNTRMNLNNVMRRAAGFDEPFPTGRGEKILCLKNNKKIGLVNGQFLTLDKVSEVREGRNGVLVMSATITTEDNENVGTHTVYLGHFQDHLNFDKDRNYRDSFTKKGMVECTWGYALTVHKSQGSQWRNVVFYDDGMGRTDEDRRRLVYTAITRAENGLVIIG